MCFSIIQKGTGFLKRKSCALACIQPRALHAACTGSDVALWPFLSPSGRSLAEQQAYCPKPRMPQSSRHDLMFGPDPGMFRLKRPR